MKKEHLDPLVASFGLYGGVIASLNGSIGNSVIGVIGNLIAWPCVMFLWHAILKDFLTSKK